MPSRSPGPDSFGRGASGDGWVYGLQPVAPEPSDGGNSNHHGDRVDERDQSSCQPGLRGRSRHHQTLRSGQIALQGPGFTRRSAEHWCEGDRVMKKSARRQRL